MWHNTYQASDRGTPLVAFNGNAITYDQIGNPLSYYNGATFGSTTFSITSFVIGKVRGAKGLQQFEALITTGKVVAGVGCVLNVGLSIYDNCTDASLSTQEKWINSTVDTIHNVGQLYSLIT